MERKGFTLLELMVVIVILGLLAAIVAPKFLKRGEEAKITTTQVQIKNIEQALKMYKLDNSFYPTTDQGLEALVKKPESEPEPRNWKGPYMDEIPKDAWGNKFLYISDGKSYIIVSKGPDGEEGTEDDIKVEKD